MPTRALNLASILLASVLVVWTAAPSQADDDDAYLKQVKPILRERCYACHGALKQESGLRLDTARLAIRGGDSGPAIQPGSPAKSELVRRISATDEAERMPPEGQPLTAEQIGILRKWIEGGAATPNDETPEADPRRHWAFAPVRRVQPPVTSQQPHPIDAYLERGRQAHGLHTVSPVEKPLLLRRLTLDLIGIPPTTEQLDAFLADDRPDAVQRVVERLLADPRHGERWGRHWMDVWRYSDWFGLGTQLRYSQKHIWHWRDWIVESVNTDKGYDRMVLEMLAADELTPTDRDALRATGFLARNYFLFNRTTWLDNTIEHTSKAFLGLTLNCAKCHDHKYDPLSQEDYYRFRAIFEPHQVRLDPAPGTTNLEQDGLPRAFDAHPDAPTYLHVRGDAKNADTSRPILPAPPAVLQWQPFETREVALPPEAHFPGLQAFVLRDHLAVAQQQIEAAELRLTAARKQLAAARRAAAQLAATDAPDPNNSDPNNSDPNNSANNRAGKPFLEDTFDKPDATLWQLSPDGWTYRDGKLVQSIAGATRKFAQSQADHPPDFLAVVRFRTTGGDKWRSVGLAFDVTEGREKLVYLSSVQPGSKLQFSFNRGGGHVYPNDAAVARPVKVNEDYELKIALRGTLLNVWVDQQLQLAYQLPKEAAREPGRLQLIAFDAQVEFDSMHVHALPESFQLAASSKQGSQAGPLTVAATEAALVLAERTLAAAQQKPAALKAAHAADLARHRGAESSQQTQLIADAALAARQHELAVAEQKLAEAEQKLAGATDKNRAALQKQHQAAEQAVAKAGQAVASPGTEYSSLRVAQKALEGPAESDASRRQPFPTVSTGRRAALAQWMVDGRNPLTARVAVNHVWMRHFGQPLVDSVNDFGRRAPQPAQLELLDWLASELMNNQWSLKHLHRLIVTSDAYALASTTRDADPATLAADPGNAYYWRRRPLRMESQVVRDSLLYLADSLSTEMGGPTMDPRKDSARRSLYFTHSRDDRDAFLAMFDDADIIRCYRRSESVIPQQALTLANSKLALTMARRLADRLNAGDSLDDESFVRLAYRTVLCIEPNQDELQACLQTLRETTALLQSRRHAAPNQRARQNLVHALLNHNDFITIR